MKEPDDLTEKILAVFNRSGNEYATVCQLVDKIFETHSSDSNSEHYRKVLRRVNALWSGGCMDARFINHYKPTEWRLKRDAQ